MGTTAVLNRCSKVFALAVALLFVAGLALAQDEPAEAPPLALQPGTFLTIRINEAISSDRNQSGDLFSGTLTQPLIVQGIVVAQRGQTVGGRVVGAKKAGMVAGVSRLEVALTRLTLADGQNVPIRTHLLARNGRPSVERDAGTVVGTTGAGAVIGAIAGRGRGAAIGAGAGAAVGTLGVLLTRGNPTIIYPESLLTFELETQVPIDTSNAPQAFRAVNPETYKEAYAPPRRVPAPELEYRPVPPTVVPPPYYVYGPPYPYYYPYYARPYYYGPSVSFVFGYPRYYSYPAYRFYRPRPIPFHGREHGRVFEHRHR